MFTEEELNAALKKKLAEIDHKLAVHSARESFWCFYKLMLGKEVADFSETAFHKRICDNLQDLYEGNITKLAIFIPPQSGKSTISSIYYPAWVFGKNRNEMIAVTSYSATMASSFNRKTQLVIANHLYNEIFPETFLNESNIRTVADGSKERNSDKFEIIRGSGSYKSVGVGGGLTGHTVTLGIIDDPFKDRADANSIVMRNRVWDWYVDVFQSRLQNKSRILMLFTRWHEDDLAGRTIEREDGWAVIKLPALKEDDSDPLDKRKIGEALWPEKHSLESILLQKKRNESSFASLYQQRPAPMEGGMIKGAWFEIVDMPGGLFHKKIVIDPAYTEDGDNDPTGILTYFEHKNDMYIYDWETVRFQTHDLIAHIKSLAVKYNLGMQSAIKIEPKANGLSLIHDLKAKTRLNVSAFSFTKGNPLSKIKGTDSKETRADGITEILSSDRVKLVRGGWNDNFLSEVKQFPNAKHDEAVDCLVMSVADVFMSRKGAGFKVKR